MMEQYTYKRFSASIFILTLKNWFLVIEKHPKIKGIEISEHCFLYTAYADDATFIPKDLQSIARVVEIFYTFSLFSGLKPNLKKCEIAGLGALKEAHLAVCCMKCTDLRNESIQILGTYFSYNNTTKEKSNFLKIVSNLQNVFNFLRFRNFNLEGRIVVFKNQAISKIVFQGQTAPVLSHIILKL